MRELTWESLRRPGVPAWLREAKFGIYTHWGIYSVPACGPNVSWYPSNMYLGGTEQNRFHIEHYGHPSKFGYKDFIPMFTGDRFDPDEWAEMFRKAGAGFAGPVAEHHDGFSMWNSAVNPWNSARMGPKRDVAGELEKAIRRQGMKFMVALHHAENWRFYPHWIPGYDTADPRYAGLYGAPHDMGFAKYMVGERFVLPDGMEFWNSQQKPDRAALDTWLRKAEEIVDRTSPDMVWFDFGLSMVPDSWKMRFLKYYYETSEAKGIDPLVTYKHHDLPAGCGLIDLELGRYDDLTYMEWITDTTVDDGEAWGYRYDASYKTPRTLIHYLVDNVSKNGYLLLNVGPTSRGEFPPQAKEVLTEMGKWLRVNGEAVYGTSPWVTYGCGPTRLEASGSFNEGKTPKYTSEDVRFTVKGRTLYAVVLGWPKNGLVLRNLPQDFRSEEICSVSMLGSEEPVFWRMDGCDLTLSCPKMPPCDHAYTFRIRRKDLL